MPNSSAIVLLPKLKPLKKITDQNIEMAKMEPISENFKVIKASFSFLN